MEIHHGLFFLSNFVIMFLTFVVHEYFQLLYATDEALNQL